MLKTILLLSMITASSGIDIDKISQYLNYGEYQYSENVKSQMDSTYKKIINIDFSRFNEDQKEDIIIFLGIYGSHKADRIVHQLIADRKTTELIKGICYFYEYQSFNDKYLQKYLAALKYQSKKHGDTKLLTALAFLRKPEIALEFINDNINNADGVGAEMMLETVEILMIRTKGKIDILKYRNIKEKM